MFRPCPLYPGEVEDYFCMDCKKPCSALSLLVGPHTNHRRETFEGALLALPQECLTEAMELKKCSEILLATEGISTYRELREEKSAAERDVLEVERQIAELQQRREQLLLQVDEKQTSIQRFETETSSRVSALVDSGEVQLNTVRNLRDIYQHQEAVNFEQGKGGAANTENMVTVSLSELRNVEEILHRELSGLQQWQMQGGFQTKLERVDTALDPANSCNNAENDPTHFYHPAVEDEDGLIRHVLMNQEKLLHPIPSTMIRSGSNAIAATGATTTATGSSRKQGQQSSSSIINTESVGAHTQAALQGAGSRERTIASEIDTLTAVMAAKRKATVSPSTTDDEYEAPSTMTSGRPTEGLVSPSVSARRSSLESPAPTAGTGGGVSFSPKSPGRYLKQYKRVRQCIKDALVVNQQALVTSLLQAIHELRREARANQVTDVERAIAVDSDVQALL